MPARVAIEGLVLSDEVTKSLAEIEEDFKEGDLTEKGYWKKKCLLLGPILSDLLKRQLREAESDFHNEVLTQKGYFKKLASIFNNVTKTESAGYIQKSPMKSTDNKPETQTSQKDLDSVTVEEDTVESERCYKDQDAAADSSLVEINGMSEDGSTRETKNAFPPNGNSNSADEMKENGCGHLTLEEEKRMMIADKLTPLVEESGEDIRTKVKAKRRSKGKNGQSQFSEESSPSSSLQDPPRRKGRSAMSSMNGQQPTIMSMFGPSSTKKRKPVKEEKLEDNMEVSQPQEVMEENDEEAEEMAEELPDSKRLKTNKDKHKEVNIVLPPAKAQTFCPDCKQVLEDPDLKFFQGDPSDAQETILLAEKVPQTKFLAEIVEEFIALVNPKLQLFSGDEEMKDSYDDRPQEKLTHFTVYDKKGHLTSFDTGLLEKNKELFVSGFIKPVFEEDPSCEADYDKVRRRLAQSEEMSELGTTTEHEAAEHEMRRSKWRRITHSLFGPPTDSNDEDECVQALHYDLPRPPKSPTSYLPSERYTAASESSLVTQQRFSASSARKRPQGPTFSQTQPSSSSSFMAMFEKATKRQYTVMEKILAEVADLKKQFANYTKSQSVTLPQECLPEGVKFPLETVEDVQALEQLLLNPVVAKRVQCHLETVGGNTVRIATVAIMKSIFSQEMAEKYCWTGATEGKEEFQILKLKDLVFRAVRMNPLTKEATQHDVKKVIQEWFRMAADRNGGRKKRMERARCKQQARIVETIQEN